MCVYVCVCVCVSVRVCVGNNCAVEILWLVLNNLSAEKLRDRLKYVLSPDVTPNG